MDQCVWNASMVNNGIRRVFHVSVPLASSGLGCSATKPTTAQPIECGMKPFRHAFVHPTKSGTEDNVQFSPSAVEEEYGI